jgi:hypothetical protein
MVTFAMEIAPDQCAAGGGVATRGSRCSRVLLGRCANKKSNIASVDCFGVLQIFLHRGIHFSVAHSAFKSLLARLIPGAQSF